MSEKRPAEIIVEGLDHPEGLAWGLDGYLYAGGEAGQIYRIDIAQRSVEVVGQTGGFILGLALDAASNIHACDSGRKQVVRVQPDGTVQEYAAGSPDRPMVSPNYPVFTSGGRLFVSDCGNWAGNDGCIYVIEPDGSCAVWCSELTAFPNGLALDEEERYLYVIESEAERVSRLPILEDGRAGTAETVVEVPLTVPDGLAFDSDGGLIISCYRPDRVYRLDPSGELSVVAEDPRGTWLASPTNIAFGGEHLGLLFTANLGRWHIARIEAPVAGRSLSYPTVSGVMG